MVFTHILVGILIGAVVSVFSPEVSTLAVYAGAIGGGFPDLDMALTHRKTFHYPVVFSIAAAGLVLLTLLYTNPAVMFIFVLVLAAATHCLMDILGGGKEMRPWREIDDRAVYNHISGNWIKPRRIVYDGSFKDLIISILSAGIIFYILRPRFVIFTASLLVIAIIYFLLRRWVTRKISEDFTTFSSYIQHWISEIWTRIT